MAKSKSKKTRKGQGAGNCESKNKKKAHCNTCNVDFNSCKEPPICPKCRKPTAVAKAKLEF